MRFFSHILLAGFLCLLFIGCYHSKYRPIDVYLTVESDYGSPNPPVGSNYLNYGMTITASTPSPLAAGPGTRYLCAGWTGTGSAPPSGSTNSVTFSITENSSVTWLWQTQYQLTTSVSPADAGTISCSPEDSWYDADTSVQLTAVPAAGYEFTEWSGALSGSDNPETLIMDAPKSVTANFIIQTVYVDGTNGDDSNSGTSWGEAVKTIQKGIDLATGGWTVLVADGTYTGTGNKNLDLAGKAIHLKSVGGAENCIIDCENSGRGFYFHSGETKDAVVEGFTIQNGSVGTDECGGGVVCGYSSSPTFTNCTISGNLAPGYGGGVFCYDSSPTFTNCTISGNLGWYGGGGVDCWSSSPTVTNCTISGNSAGSFGGGVCCSFSSPTFRNSIIWGNTASIGHQIYTDDSSCSVTLSYSCYANDVVGAGQVNPDNSINDDPQFVDVANKNYHLQSTSPCIDRGNNSYVPAGVTTDLDGNPRIRNGTVDIGAYEYQQ